MRAGYRVRCAGAGSSGWKPRWLHADASGCWIVGADGIGHCDHAGTVRTLDEDPVSKAALAHGILATARSRRRGDIDTPVELRTVHGHVATALMPAKVESLGPARDGFLAFMRTGPHGQSVGQNERGPWCARIGLDGTVAPGSPWPRPYWDIGDVTLCDVEAPIAVAQRSWFSQVLDDDLLPVYPVAFTSDFAPHPLRPGPWWVERSSSLSYRCHEPAYDNDDAVDMDRFTYFRLDPQLTRPASWAIAPGFPKDIAALSDLGQLWISTTRGLFATEAGALDTPGALSTREVTAAMLEAPDLPVAAPPGMGDPDVWAEHERARLIRENRDHGLVEIYVDGWFPSASLIVTFTVDQLPNVVCARRYRLFTRDGDPALWRGAPTLMDSIRCDIDESVGINRLRSTPPGNRGWIWV